MMRLPSRGSALSLRIIVGACTTHVSVATTIPKQRERGRLGEHEGKHGAPEAATVLVHVAHHQPKSARDEADHEQQRAVLSHQRDEEALENDVRAVTKGSVPPHRLERREDLVHHEQGEGEQQAGHPDGLDDLPVGGPPERRRAAWSSSLRPPASAPRAAGGV